MGSDERREDIFHNAREDAFFSRTNHGRSATFSTTAFARGSSSMAWPRRTTRCDGRFHEAWGILFSQGFDFSLSRSGTRATARNEMMLPTDYLCLPVLVCLRSVLEGGGLAIVRAPSALRMTSALHLNGRGRLLHVCRRWH